MALQLDHLSHSCHSSWVASTNFGLSSSLMVRHGVPFLQSLLGKPLPSSPSPPLDSGPTKVWFSVNIALKPSWL
jgi:hypothetical protein